MNAIAERWIGGCRRELYTAPYLEPCPSPADPERLWDHHNQHRPHRPLSGAALKPPPVPVIWTWTTSEHKLRLVA